MTRRSSAPGCLDAGRVHWGAYCVGAAQRLLDMAAARASTRRQFGRPLRAHQAIEFKIADMAASLHAARLVAYEASWRYDHAPETRQLGRALSKLIAAEVAFRIADDTMQIFGLAEARRASGARGSGDDHLVRA